MPSAAVRPAADQGARVGTPLHLPRWLLRSGGLAIAATYFGVLGHFALAEPDEPRYAEIAREMLELGDWVTPHLNYVKYFEKPPLVYWLTAINFRLFGMSEPVVRLWPALFGILGIVLAYAIGRSMYGRWVGCAAAALLATTPMYFGLSQFLILDMPLSTFMTVALGSFWFAYRCVPNEQLADVRRRRTLVLFLYGATALAVLTKGPVAVVLVGGTIGAFLLLRGDLAAVRWLLSALGTCLFLVLTLPWFVAVSRRNPEFFDFFFVKQHVARFLSPDEHQQPLWFFVPIVVGGMLPWTSFVLLAPRVVGRFLTRLATRRVSAAALYCVVWSAVVFVFFSLSGSKLGTYVLPMFCPLAILAARFLQQLIEHGRVQPLHRGYVALLVLAALTLLGALITAEVVDDWRAAAIVPLVWVGGTILAVAAAVALMLLRRRALLPSLASLVFGMLALQGVAVGGRGVAADYRRLGVAIRQQARPDDLVVNYRHYVQGIPFYARRRVVSAGSWGELDFGSRQGDQRAFFWRTDAELLNAWASDRHVFLVINRSEMEPLRSQLYPAPREIAAHNKKVLVVNF